MRILKIILIIFISYNILLFTSLDNNIHLVWFYWRNVANIAIPYSVEDIPYMRKVRFLHDIQLQKLGNKDLITYISSNTLPKVYPTISNKPLWFVDSNAVNINDINNNINKITAVTTKLDLLGQNFSKIKAEVMNVYNNHRQLLTNMGEHYGDDSVDFKEDWKSLDIIKENIINEDIEHLFPDTISTIKRIPAFFGWMFISVLAPGTKIPRHRGKYNYKLTCHLGIDGCDGCEFIVENEKLGWKEGKFFVFNDGCYHQVNHNGTENRIVLIFDMVHFEIGEDVRDFLVCNRL